MHSPGEARIPFERAGRAVAFALLALTLWRVVAATGAADAPRVHAALGGGVDARTRDSLAALAGAGARVTWSGAIAPVAAMAEPVREPAAGWRVSVVSREAAALGDSLGPLDSLDAGGGTLIATGVRGALTATEGATTARALPADTAALGRVLVLGRAGWESKFVIAALEEQGWLVDARLRVGAGIDVTQGGATTPSLARHAAVVVLDTAVGREDAAIQRFVRAGGGLVLAGEGTAAPSIQSLLPARVVRVEPAETRDFAGHEPTHALPLHALGALRPDAVLLESRDGTPAVAARRVGAGRVVQMGYTETWRWRMQAESRGVEEHRAYWSRLVGTAAAASFAPRAGDAVTDAGADAAPLALTVAALGPASDAPARAAPRGPALPLWMVALILALLVAEWASRRTRGAA